MLTFSGTSVKCFCINFLPLSYYDKLVATIHHNNIEDDEFTVGNFTLSDAKSIHAPVIQEAFLNMECVLKDIQDLSGAGITSMVIGQVQHISVEEKYARGYEHRYNKDGFMMLIPGPTGSYIRSTKSICNSHNKN